MHEEPQVLNYVPPGPAGKGPRLRPGMTLALEPMVNAGTWRSRVSYADGWTVMTADELRALGAFRTQYCRH